MTTDGSALDDLGSIAHDLQTPLHIITGYARLLLDQTCHKLAPGQLLMLERISANAQDLSVMIRRMVEVAT